MTNTLDVHVVDVQRTNISGQDEHHLYAADLDNLPAGQKMGGIVLLKGCSIHLETVTPLDLQIPLGRGWIEVYHGGLAGEDFVGSEVNVDEVVVFGIARGWVGVDRLGSTANVDGEMLYIVGPVLRGHLGIRLDMFVGLL